MKKEKTSGKPLNKNLKTLYLMVFLLSFGSAIPAYIQSSFLSQYVNLSLVSSFFVIANLSTLIAILLFPRAIKKLGNYKVTKVVTFSYLISLVLVSFTGSIALLFLSFLIMILSNNLLYINMDIMVESFSKDSSTGRTRAIYFTASNLAWILAQLFSGQLADLEGYRLSFIFAAAITVPFLLIFMYHAKNLKDKAKYNKIDLLATIRKTMTDNNLRGVFGLAFLLNLFYSSAVIFIPIYLNQVLGFSWDKLSVMFAIMLIPFVLFEIPAGTLADKYIGEKEIFHTGFFILIIALMFFAFNTSHSIVVWTAILFFSRTGAALVESMRESYFFKMVDAKDVQLINFFRITGPLGYVAGALIAAVTVTGHSLNYVFILLAIVMSSSFIFLAGMKDSK